MNADARPSTVLDLPAMKAAGRRIVMLTCYDAMFARLLEQAGVDVLLVGDSVNQVLAGADSTLSATLDQMIYHGTAVRRGSGETLVFVDMPFLTYQVSIPEAIRNAGRVMQETGVHGVKLEGGRHIAPTIQALVEVGIPVMGHVGLMPQSVHALGGYRARGRATDEAAGVMADAVAIAEAGAFSVVVEGVLEQVAQAITARIPVPTIGIGASADCDGQVLVVDDMLGMFGAFKPRFVKRYAELADEIASAAASYAADVRTGAFPGPDNVFGSLKKSS